MYSDPASISEWHFTFLGTKKRTTGVKRNPVKEKSSCLAYNAFTQGRDLAFTSLDGKFTVKRLSFLSSLPVSFTMAVLLSYSLSNFFAYTSSSLSGEEYSCVSSVREYFHSFLLQLKLQEDKENNDVGFLPFSSCGNCPMGKRETLLYPHPVFSAE